MPSRRLALLSITLAVAALSGCKTTPVIDTPLPVTPIAAPEPRKIKIGLALGGGAARGFAHIGVIKALEAQGIYPDVVVGTSAGSVVGALYAAGNTGFQLQRLAFDMDEAAISDWAMPLFGKSTGVLKGEALQAYVNKAVNNQPMEKLKIPFGAVAADLKNGQPILFQRGNPGMAVRASSSVPGVFQPVTINGKTYVDGGLVAPVPVKFARDMGADFVIAPSLGKMAGNDFAGRNQAILAGEQAAALVMAQIKQKLEAKRKQ